MPARTITGNLIQTSLTCIVFSCAFLVVTCQNVSLHKDLFYTDGHRGSGKFNLTHNLNMQTSCDVIFLRNKNLFSQRFGPKFDSFQLFQKSYKDVRGNNKNQILGRWRESTRVLNAPCWRQSCMDGNVRWSTTMGQIEITQHLLEGVL